MTTLLLSAVLAFPAPKMEAVDLPIGTVIRWESNEGQPTVTAKITWMTETDYELEEVVKPGEYRTWICRRVSKKFVHQDWIFDRRYFR